MAKHVLVVDDHVDTIHVLRLQLESLGCECRGVFSGSAALETAMTFVPDVAIIDLNLPDIDGYEVARVLRAAAAGRPLQLIALTGSSENRTRAIEAGFDHYVVKPITFEELRHIVRAE